MHKKEIQCQGSHSLAYFSEGLTIINIFNATYDDDSSFPCDICRRTLTDKEGLYGCFIENYAFCEPCANKHV